MYEWHGYGGGMMWFLWIPILLLIIWIVVMVAGRNGASSFQRKSPEDILKERYARGEIDRTEFQQKLRDLVADPDPKE